MEVKKLDSLKGYNLDFISDCKIFADDVLKIAILTSFVNKICHEKDGKYYFTKNDESFDNHRIIDVWINTILKLAPATNKTQIRGGTKKVFIALKHLCKDLEGYGITFENGIIENNETGIKMQCHYIGGI